MLAILVILITFGIALAHIPEGYAPVKRQVAETVGSHSMRKARHVYDWCENQVTGEFDHKLKITANKHITWDPNGWCKLKTVMIVESSGNPNAISPAGAQSLFQLMPPTFSRFAKCRNVFDPECNIDTGIRHLAYLNKFWYFDRTQDCRDHLVWASSNWGEGNVLREQSNQHDARCITEQWNLPRETRHHLARITRYLELRNLEAL